MSVTTVGYVDKIEHNDDWYDVQDTLFRNTKGQANGLAELGSDGKVPSSQLPSIPSAQIQSDYTQNDNTKVDYIKNKPTLGTAAALDVPSSGNASTSQVVKGDDTRLTDARNAADVSAWAKANTKPSYTASEVGLGNVDNTSDATKKTNFTGSIASGNTGFVTGGDVYTGLSGKLDTSLKGANNGLAELDANGLVPSTQLPSYVDDVLNGTAQNVTETAAGTYSATGFIITGQTTPCTPEDGKTYVDTTSNIQYRWTGTVFVSMGSNITLGETNMTAYRGDRGKTAYDHATETKLGTATTSGFYKVAGTAQGHIASLTDVQKSDITGLGIPDTDENVKQSPSTDNGTYEVLFSGSADNTEHTEGVKKAATLRFNPSIGALMEGNSTVASGNYSHAEGYQTGATSTAAHAEGYQTTASGQYSHAEGYQTTTTGSGFYSHAEGRNVKASGESSHAEGYATTAKGEYSHAEGQGTSAGDMGSHAEGRGTVASGSGSHAEGTQTKASGDHSHAEGYYTSATNFYSHSEGNKTSSSGIASHAEGNKTTASGNGAHAEGGYTTASSGGGTIAIGENSHAEGNETTASAASSHAEGNKTSSSGIASHAEGKETRATNTGSHAEGYSTTASGNYSHAEGASTQAIGTSCHAEGASTTASYYYSHAEGYYAYAAGQNSHAEGLSTTSSGFCSHAEGEHTGASSTASHAEGYRTTASGIYAHAEGYQTGATSTAAHVEGYRTSAFGQYSHAEGNQTTASAESSHAEGYHTYSTGTYSHAEGLQTTAKGNGAHAEGINTSANVGSSHAEGSATTADGSFSHAEGDETITQNPGSHAEGYQTTVTMNGHYAHTEGYQTGATSTAAHAEGCQTNASGNYSHAEGNKTTSAANYSHAEGVYTCAAGEGQHVSGKYNIPDTTSLFIIGNGTATTARSNAMTVAANGDIQAGNYNGVNIVEVGNKLATIESGAEVNVQSDWQQSNSSADDYIKNKPEAYDALWQNNDILPNTSDTKPYLYRATTVPNGAVSYVKEELVGCSVAWNQMVQNGDFATTGNGWTTTRGSLSVSSNVGTFTSGAGSDNALRNVLTDYYIAGHKYLISFKYKSNVAFDFQPPVKANVVHCEVASNWTTVTLLLTNSSYVAAFNTAYWYNYSTLTAGAWVLQLKEYQVTDLTLAFGSSVADTLYAMTNNGGIDWLRNHNYPIDQYTQYGYYLVSTKPSAKKVVGKNLWDGTYSVTGAYLSADGTENAIANWNITSYVPVEGSQNYVVSVKVGSNNPTAICWYDANYTYINGVAWTAGSRSTSVSMPANAKYLRASIYITNQEVQIEIGTSSTTYAPYTSTTYSLGSTELRGHLIVQNGEIVAEGDVRESNREVTRYYALVNLGDITYEYNSTYAFFVGVLPVNAKAYGTQNTPDVICAKYVAIRSNAYNVGVDKSISLGLQATISEYVWIKDSDYTSASAFKTAMNGVYAVIPLATPTTETSSPFADPMIIHENGTEEFIDTRDIPVPVGHNTKYYTASNEKFVLPPVVDNEARVLHHDEGGFQFKKYNEFSDDEKTKLGLIDTLAISLDLTNHAIVVTQNV